MATLYLDRKGLELRLDGKALALYENAKRVRTVPLALLDRVVIRAETALTSGLLGALAEAGAVVTVLSGRQGRRLATVTGRFHNDARIRLAQYQRAQDAAFRLAWARRLLAAKIGRQITALRTAVRQRPDLRKPLHDALASLQGARERLALLDVHQDISTLLGMEGAAQSAYFRGLMALFPASLGFTGRNRRPPRDPVNACLSLGYTLAHFEAVRASYAAGLDPFIGFLHEPAFGRESLACDLIEPLRARLDLWVWEMFRTRRLREEHFRVDKGACLLDKAGRAVFYENFERQVATMGRWLRRVCRLMAKTLQQDAPPLANMAGEDDL